MRYLYERLEFDSFIADCCISSLPDLHLPSQKIQNQWKLKEHSIIAFARFSSISVIVTPPLNSTQMENT